MSRMLVCLVVVAAAQEVVCNPVGVTSGVTPTTEYIRKAIHSGLDAVGTFSDEIIAASQFGNGTGLPFPIVPGLSAQPAISSLPSLPSLPAAPALPNLPAVPALPALPALPTLPTLPSQPAFPTIATSNSSNQHSGHIAASTA